MEETIESSTTVSKETTDVSDKVSESLNTKTSETSMKKASGSSESKNSETSGYDWLSFGTSWSTNWLKTAKERTSTTFELVKKDLSEFSDAVATEATAIASNAVESMKQQAQNLQNIVGPVFAQDDDVGAETEGNGAGKLSEGGELKKETEEKQPRKESTIAKTAQSNNSGWKLPQMSEIANNPWMKTLVATVKSIAQEETTADEDKITEIIMPKSETSEKCALPNQLLYALQVDRGTYLNPPEGDEQLYSMWLDEFDLDEHDEEINSLLRNCPSMREIYQELVPQEVSSATFWERYFYKVHQSSLIERCKEAVPDEGFSVEACKINKLNAETERNACESPDQCINNDETWSMCSSVEMEELSEPKGSGNQTPKADKSPKTKEKEDGKKSSDSWIDWEE